jgi:iron complex outermembrane receptor protein
MHYKYNLTAAIVVAAAISAPALAQEVPAPANETGQLGEIIVTATRRQESIQSVPIAITAIDAETLKRSEIHDIKGLQFAAPGLNFSTSTGDRTILQSSMRGIYVGETLITVDPAVGMYINGVYIARTSGLNIALVDMARVEVMRGPQGTLFGRNTIAGAINLIPAEPKHEWGGSLTASLGNYGAMRLTGVANVPLGEKFAFRIAAEHSDNHGWGRNTRLDKPLNDDNISFVRASLKADLGRLTALVAYDYARLAGGGQLSKVTYANPCTVPGPNNTTVTGPNSFGPCGFVTASGNPQDAGLSRYINTPFYETQGSVWGEVEVTAQGFGATLTYDLGGGVTAKSITGYRKMFRTAPRGADIDGTPYFILKTSNGPYGFSLTTQDQFTEELQLYGKAFDDRLDWIGGFYYFKEDAVEGPGYAFTLSAVAASRQRADIHNTSLGGFAQVSFAITPQFKITGGIRYTQDKRQMITMNDSINTSTTPPTITCSVAAAVLDVPGVCRATLPVRTFNYAPWTAGVDWKPSSDILVYAKASRGHRAGGYNLRGTSATTLDPYGPESALAYELGFKGSMLDRRLRINASVYNTEYTDIQISRTVPTGIGAQVANRIDNAAKARIRGGELEVQALPMQDLRLSASASYTDAKYTALLPGSTISLTDKIQGVPKYTYNLGLDYQLNAPGASADFHLDWDWRSRVFYSNLLVGSQEPYGILNGSIAVRLDKLPRMTFKAYARNLLGRKYYDRLLDLSGNAVGVVVGVQGAPRLYGGSISYEF